MCLLRLWDSLRYKSKCNKLSILRENPMDDAKICLMIFVHDGKCLSLELVETNNSTISSNFASVKTGVCHF